MLGKARFRPENEWGGVLRRSHVLPALGREGAAARVDQGAGRRGWACSWRLLGALPAVQRVRAARLAVACAAVSWSPAARPQSGPADCSGQGRPRALIMKAQR